MKCFKHFKVDAVCSEEIRVGRGDGGSVYGFRPVCQQCLDEHHEEIKHSKKFEIIALSVFIVVFALSVCAAFDLI